MDLVLEFSPALMKPPVDLELPVTDTLCFPHRRGHEVGKRGTEGEEGRGRKGPGRYWNKQPWNPVALLESDRIDF